MAVFFEWSTWYSPLSVVSHWGNYEESYVMPGGAAPQVSVSVRAWLDNFTGTWIGSR